MESDIPRYFYFLAMSLLIADAANCLQPFNLKMAHMTCVAHVLYRVANKMLGQFTKIEKLVSNMKKVFLKAPNSIDLFKTEAPSISLPPSPILTR